MLKQTLAKSVLFGRIQFIFWSVFVLLFVTFANVIPRTSNHASAATSSTINFQARLLQANGAVVADGYYNVDFKIYNHVSNGAQAQGTCSVNCLWEETYYDSNGVTAGNDNRVQVINGYLTVNLGSQTAFTTINWDQEIWLTMNIGGTSQTATPTWDGEMTPRLKFTASPYAFAAGKLQTTSGANTSTLGFASQTASRSLLLPDEAGTLCIQSSANCGFAAATGAIGYIQNTTSLQASSNFNISGNGVVGTAMSIGTGVAPANGLLTVGTSLTTGAAGGMYFGTDTSLYRSNSSELTTGGALLALGRVVANSSTTARIVLGSTDGANSVSGIAFGSTSIDTSLYRTNANELTTGGAFLSIGRLVANSSGSVKAGVGVDLDGTTAISGISLGTSGFDTKISRGSTSGMVSIDGSSSAASLSLGATSTTHGTAGVYLEKSSTLGSVNVTTTGAGITLFRAGLVGDTNSRYSIRGNGDLYWGPGGVTSSDTWLGRTNNGQISIGSAGAATNTSVLVRAGSTQTVDIFRITDSAGTTNLTTFASDGSLVFGSTNTANLYRSANDTLKTDDTFVVGSKFTLDITNNRLIVGPSGGDTTGTLTILGTKTNAGDPTGTVGAMYFNSSLNSFRCYTSATTGWQDCGPQTRKLTADVTNNTTTMASVTGLSFAVSASTDYSITCDLIYQSASTTVGPTFSLTGPASPTSVTGMFSAFGGASLNTAAGYSFIAYDGGNGLTAVPAANTSYPATFNASFRNGTTAGTLTLRLKSSAATQVTLKAGSSCRLTSL